MNILKNIKLAEYTTFKIGGPARYLCTVKDQFDALEAFEFAKQHNLPTFVLGAGSNLLVSDAGFNGLVMKVESKGVELLSQDEQYVWLKVASGEVWDEVVGFAIKNSWWGMENLSHIPGFTGAIAVQNVGAYGQEAKNIIESVLVFDKSSGQILSLNNSECNFGYRRSIFNTTSKGQYIIFNVTFKLLKQGQPNLSYRDLAIRFKGQTPNLVDIRRAVVAIRDAKYPFPTAAKNGNAGSFFKNPILSAEEFSNFKNRLTETFGSSAVDKMEQRKFDEHGQTKIPAAFLLELCGLKGKEYGGARINPDQPLVIINHTGQATAAEVLSLANEVKGQVFAHTGINLNFEPELVGF